jgi:Domain of unknown function (DUF4384)
MKNHQSLRYMLMYLLLFSFVTLVVTDRPNAQSGDDKDVSFRWAIVGIVGSEDDQKLISLTRSTVLNTGDRVKMFIEPQNCFVYVIYRSKTDDVALLFPYSSRDFGKVHGATEKHFIPMGDQWFELDENIGSEIFYLVASSSRLSTMENLLIKHEHAEKTDQDMLAKEILAEIRNLKREYRKIEATAERPWSIGGSLRGMTPNETINPSKLESIAEQISVNKFYSRTYAIDHR